MYKKSSLDAADEDAGLMDAEQRSTLQEVDHDDQGTRAKRPKARSMKSLVRTVYIRILQVEDIYGCN